MEIFYLLKQSCNILKFLLKQTDCSILELLRLVGRKFLNTLDWTGLRVAVSLCEWLVSQNHSSHWIVGLGLICFCTTSWSDNTDVRFEYLTLLEIMLGLTSFIASFGIDDFLYNFSSLFLNRFSWLRPSIGLWLVWLKTYLIFRLLVLSWSYVCIVKSQLLFVVLRWVNWRIRYYSDLVTLVSGSTNQGFPTFKKFATIYW